MAIFHKIIDTRRGGGISSNDWAKIIVLHDSSSWVSITSIKEEKKHVIKYVMQLLEMIHVWRQNEAFSSIKTCLKKDGNLVQNFTF